MKGRKEYAVYAVIDGVRNYLVHNRTMGFDLILKPEDPKDPVYFRRREIHWIPDEANCGEGFQFCLDMFRYIQDHKFTVYRGKRYEGNPAYTEIGLETRYTG